jgi:hypothetical protein
VTKRQPDQTLDLTPDVKGYQRALTGAIARPRPLPTAYASLGAVTAKAE